MGGFIAGAEIHGFELVPTLLAQAHPSGPTPRDLFDEITERDRRDSERSTAPLRAADDAILLDTTDLNIQQVVDEILKLYSHRLSSHR